MTAASDHGGSRVAVGAARLLAALAVVAVLVAVTLPLASGYGYLDDLLGTPEATIGATFSVLGAVVVGRREAGVVGWMLLGIGLTAALTAVCASVVAFSVQGDIEASAPESLGLLVVPLWILTWSFLPSYLGILTILPHFLPNGRLVGRWWRIPVTAAFLVLLVQLMSLAVAPGEHLWFSGFDNPLANEQLHRVLDAPIGPFDIEFGSSWLTITLAAIALSSLAVRVVRADPAVRRQVGWVAYSLAAAVALVLALAPWAPAGAVNLPVALIPIGIGVAVLRYRLYDLDLLVNRTIVAGVLVAGAALSYAAIVGWLGAAVDTGRGVTSFVAAFAIALAFQPARAFVQRSVDRLFFGRRGDPLALLGDVDRALREAASPRDALEAAVAVVRDGLRLTMAEARVTMPSGELVRATAGHARGGEATELPLEIHGQRVGQLHVGSRARDTHLSGADLHVLSSLAGPLASAAYALRLSGDLEESHAGLIEAREAERRRLRRDLHDGLGPQLAGVVMGVDSVRAAIGRGDEGRASNLALEVGERARAAVDDVRRLVSGLRPPVLDDLGLIGALRSTVPDDGRSAHGPSVTVTAERDLPPLPAAVEVAAYRIASEAITNAVRHSGAGTVAVVLAVEPGALQVRVTDDGRGIPAAATAGVGLASMRERATELGGWCRVVPAEPCGTSVVAHLPIGATR